ncbi:GNAT family N-acetyltransferase [Kutzneria chonburiensis]|uniref:GNAT family N-acetyltransferase n=1 Tax=Kutzneria chonburiensis TaxID=1483604 RepID=A0ABV6MP63_9PSEU|nr:GNAT family N-acetyltransferase [Kutzneria chonburiensis]
MDLLTAADVRLMQGLAQRIVATRLDLVNSDASVGELAWNWGRNHRLYNATWPRRLWFAGDDLVAWGWAQLPRQVRLRDGSAREVTDAALTHQVHPDHAGLVDEVIDWFEDVTPGLVRTMILQDADEFALQRWTARGYVVESASDSWTQLNVRELHEIDKPLLPQGFRFRNADEAGTAAVVQAHVDAWPVTTYNADAYADLRATPPYRGDLHVLVEAPDGTMACSAVMWLDEVNKTAEFEPVGTHPDFRRRGLGRALLLHGMHVARDAGATQMTVACLGAAEHPNARGLYYSVGFRYFSHDIALHHP